ncbi:MAG: hypothetical protein IKS10_09515 [Lachnospiraceae bacterium]|nr:hypothetical protein [Lachnospiraceae bacterium]
MQAIIKKYAILFISIVLYRLFLDRGYYDVIAQIYEYSGFSNQSDFDRTLLSWIIFVPTIPMIIRIIHGSERTSSMIVTMLYFLMFVPNTVMISTVKYSIRYSLLSSLYWYILIIGTVWLNKNRKSTESIRIKHRKLTNFISLVYVIGAVSFLVVLYISARYAHFRLNIDLFAVYEYRTEARNYNLPTWLRYMFAWTRAINPMLLGYAIQRKNYIIAVVLVVAQLLSFGIDGMKMTLFVCVLTAFLSLYFNGTIKWFNRKMVYGFSFVSFIAWAEYFIVGNFTILSIVVRRIMFLPNLINYYYYDYFQLNVPDYFRGSIGGLIGSKSPYGDLGHTIGEVYFARPEMNANNGMIADAVTNMGTIGFVLMPLVLLLLLRIFDRASHGISVKTLIPIAMFMAIQLINSFMTTCLLTHGFLVIYLLVTMFPKREPKR